MRAVLREASAILTPFANHEMTKKDT